MHIHSASKFSTTYCIQMCFYVEVVFVRVRVHMCPYTYAWLCAYVPVCVSVCTCVRVSVSVYMCGEFGFIAREYFSIRDMCFYLDVQVCAFYC